MSTRPQYRRLTTDQPKVDLEFRKVEEAFGLLGPLAGALEVKPFALLAGNNVLRHGLGRVPTGRILIYTSAVSNLYDVTATADTWTINASSPTNVRLIFI